MSAPSRTEEHVTPVQQSQAATNDLPSLITPINFPNNRLSPPPSDAVSSSSSELQDSPDDNSSNSALDDSSDTDGSLSENSDDDIDIAD